MSSEPLWRQCATWLHKLRLISTKHAALSATSKPQDVIDLLRNGVILCQLAHTLDPHCIDLTKVIYFPPEAESVDEFVCRNNIFLFLRSLVTGLELDQEYFFDPSALYQYQDVGKVFRTLSALSRSKKVEKFNIPGFPKKERKLEKRLETEEGLYQDLRKLFDEGKTKSELSRHTGSNEEIYDSVISPSKPKRTLSFKPTPKREYPVKEFLETEGNYLVNLLMVRDFFRDQISQLNPLQKQTVFKKLDEMIVLHTTVCKQLRETKNDIGRVLMKNFPSFSIYREYCVSLGKVQAMLQNEEMRNPLLKSELEDCRQAAKSPFPLSGHIVIPFQRLLKYHLMLDAILKLTDENDPQYDNLLISHQAFTALNLEINELKRAEEEEETQRAQDAKDLLILEKVESSIKSMNLPNRSKLQDYGRMVRAGDLAAYGHQGEADYAFLLQTVLIFCNKPRLLQHRFRFKFALKLCDYELSYGPDHIRLSNRLNLIPPLILTSKVKQDARCWFLSLSACVDLVCPPDDRGHSLLVTSLPGKSCSQCKRKLLEVVGQAYRCRACDSVFHLDCLSASTCLEANLPNIEFRRTGSIALPTLEERNSMGSTLSLAVVRRDNTEEVRHLQKEWKQEKISLPLEHQAWYAGLLDTETAGQRLKYLPCGTFLVRKRGEGDDYALDVKTTKGVNHLKIFCSGMDENNLTRFSFSQARDFATLEELIRFYRDHDLLENFSYKHMVGLKLSLPYKDA